MRSRWFGVFVAAFAAAVSIWAYPRLPEMVATHWNLRGQVDGYSSRFWAVTIMPLVILAVTGLFRVLPKLDPRRENYEKFLSSYWLLTNAVIAFLGVAHVLIIGNGLGYEVHIDRLLPLSIGLLLTFLGNYLTRVEPNWFVGIRTPWTLSSDTVWRRTHRTGGWLFVLAGIVVALAGFAPRAAVMPIIIATVLVAALIPVVQSYILWKREQHDHS